MSASSTASFIHSRWEIAARLVADSRDLLDARPGAGGGEPSAALTTRGWASFLLSLEPHELEAIETRGPDADWPDRTPAALRELVERARLACSVPVLHDASTSAPTPSPRPGETPRKRAQIDAFARLVAPLAALSSRVLDVGSGHGHLTRDLAGRLGLPVVGLERDPVLANRARALSPDGRSVFTVTDVLRDGLALSPGDCVVGLHACGELGEVMVRSVAQTRAAAVVLVSCCLQKRRQLSRAPLGVPAGVEPAALELPRSLLGLSNLAARDEGVEASRADNLAARARRLALNRLLSEAGEPVRLGAEIEGLNRRAAHRELPALVARAFALRHRPAPSPTAIAEADAWAQVEHARARRLSVPRALLSRVLEVCVLLDRAAFLERHGLHVEVGELFPAAVSPRNLALVARVSGSVIFATPD